MENVRGSTVDDEVYVSQDMKCQGEEDKAQH